MTRYITTPLYYVNDEPHIGHAYTTILADVLTRYHRLFGNDARFLTGVDEHGQKILEAAAKTGLTPQAHCDAMASRYTGIWQALGIEYDVFFRTTHPEHQRFVQDVLSRLMVKGDIYTGEYAGWYCTPDERFWTEKDLVDGNCPLCGRPVEHLVEKNYFFRMGAYQNWLIDYIEQHPDFVRPGSRRNEVLGFLRQRLGDLCISRPVERLSWGIPLPFDPRYVTYVWFDALFNYISATRIHSPLKESDWPADLHLIGKDILTTHAVYWPIMLHAAGYEPPRSILAHGWWLTDRGKMSKSQGRVIRPLELTEKYGVDAVRYVLMREMTPGADAVFAEELLIERYNSELANDLGNLYSRLAKLWHKFDCASLQSGQRSHPWPVESDLEEKIAALHREVRYEIEEEIRPPAAVEKILSVVRGLNRQVEVWAPWKRGNDDPAGLAASLEWALRSLDLAAGLLAPVMPARMGLLHEAIGIGPKGVSPRVDVTLFPRIETKRETTDAARVGKSAAKPVQSESPQIGMDDFARLDLRAGVIVEAESIPGADKLLKLQVDLGYERRQIVAGIAKSYAPHDLVGRRIVVVANLKPALLRGIESSGMLLAASDGSRHYLIGPDGDAPVGSRVK